MNRAVTGDDTLPTAERPGGAEEALKARLPEHLIQVPGSEWALWRCIGLRGAGFPSSEVLKLASTECAESADSFLQAEHEARQALERALNSVNRELDALKLSNRWDETRSRDPLLKALRFLKMGKLPKTRADAPTPADADIEACHVAAQQRERALEEFHQAFKQGTTRVSQAICEIVNTSQFQEAVIWQNRRAFHTGIDALLRKSAGAHARGTKLRQYEELVANYLQRYSVKNDTIGFFGPVGWARFTSRTEAIETRPGASLLATRTTYFEGWCIDALAERLSQDEEILPWAAPRRIPFVRLEGSLLYAGSTKPIKLPKPQVAVLKACDGARTAKSIAVELIGDSSVEINVEAEVYAILREFKNLGVIGWGFELPIGTYPENALREQLERVEPERLKSEALAALNRLKEGREEVARAAGNPVQLDQALSSLESTFTELTGAASTRGAGKTYAGRTLVFEDCRRDIEVEVGPEILQSLARPLSILLTSARWITDQIQELYRKAFKQVYLDLARKGGSARVDGMSFWLLAQPMLFGETDRPVDAIEPLLQERWASLLTIPEGQRRVVFDSAELEPRVLAAFDAPRPGWQFAHYHSPDLMIAAASAEAIRQGDYQLVMGEIHCAMNTLGASLFVDQHERPEEIFRAVESDLPTPRLVVVSPKHWPNATLRTRHVLKSPADIFISLASDSISEPATRPLSIGEMIVEDRGRGLFIRTRDGRVAFDIIEAFGDILSTFAVNSLKLLRPARHAPRVNFDRLVVSRETWRFTAQEIEFAYLKDEAERFAGARRWAQRNGLPRFVFVKSPVEKKPFYLDFDSPVYLDNFAKVVRRTMENETPEAWISVSEMLPTTDQCWLPDADGRRYTSELRMVALDLRR